MKDWTGGYVAEIGYTYGYYDLLNPLRARLALLRAGIALPEEATACELGFGQGISTNIHAAGSATQWYGTDFNPAQAAYARDLAANIECGPQLFEQSFADFCSRTDLPDFDYIGLHGIWSWISDENRAVIVDFIRRKLKVGGLLYISYNTQPGWAAMVPMRNLLKQHADVLSPTGSNIVAKVDSALAFAAKLMEANPAYARANPKIAERLQQLQGMDRQYLAHEYFNSNWLPMSFSDMSGWLSDAKLDFACSAIYSEQAPALNLSPAQQALLDELPDPAFRQTVYDFMINQQFRRDYWIKGLRPLQTIDYAEQLRAQHVLLCEAPADIKLTIAGALGEGKLAPAIYTPLITLMGDHTVRSIGQIEQALAASGITLIQLHEACMLLIEKGAMVYAHAPEVSAARRPHTERLNLRLLRQARGTAEVTALASPVSGGGVPVSRFHQLFVSAMLEGQQHAVDLARHVAQVLRASQQGIAKDGKVLISEPDLVAELTGQAEEFLQTKLPLLRRLGVL